MTADRRAPVAVVVLTWNEGLNLDACLASVCDWARELYVVDSHSTDNTREIAARRGATTVTHAFETHARQWRWALETLPISSPWVLALDADQRVSVALRDSLIETLAADSTQAGFFVNRRQIFRGRWIKHGGYYPKYMLKLFRPRAVRLDDRDLVDHHFRVDGPVGTLAGDLIEDNRNEWTINAWVAKHTRYAERQAREELERLAEDGRDGGPFGGADDRVAWRKRLWRRLPLYVRPWLYFTYRYVFRLGFLDGREGFVFHFMHAWWYRLLVDINREELAAGHVPEPSERPAVPASSPDGAATPDVRR